VISCLDSTKVVKRSFIQFYFISQFDFNFLYLGIIFNLPTLIKNYKMRMSENKVFRKVCVSKMKKIYIIRSFTICNFCQTILGSSNWRDGQNM